MDSRPSSPGANSNGNPSSTFQRRKFLAGTAASGAATLIGNTPMPLAHAFQGGPAHAFQGGPAHAYQGDPAESPSETLQPAKTQQPRRRIGSIGTGGRWGSIGRSAMEFGDLVAVCDVDSKHLTNASQAVEKHQGRKPRSFENYKDLLACDDIEVVTIVTPDHWHTKMAIEAMRAGKHVYCEKPLTLTIDEGNQIIRVLEETGRTFQVGTQQRTEFGERFLTATALCRDGRLGAIHKVICGIGGAPESESIPVVAPPKELNWDLWLGPAPEAEYRYAPRATGRPATRGHYEFRWWYESSGGKMTDWGAHHVDIAQWALGKSDTSPIVFTPLSVTHPVPLDDRGNPTDPSRYNTATEFQVSCRFADDTELEISSTAPNGIRFIGEKGELFVSRKELRGTAVDDLKDRPLPDELLDSLCKGHRPRGPHAHMRDFFKAIDRGGQPISDVYSHHRAITTCHLANIAIRLGRTVRWDPETQNIIDDPQAKAMQSRQARKGFEIDA